jgi:hypothetical protein
VGEAGELNAIHVGSCLVHRQRVLLGSTC